MNARMIVCLLVLVGCATSQPRPAQAGHDDPYRVEVYSVTDFYEPLAAHGHWVYVPPHGWCWYPADVGRDWRPYTIGHWLWTDDDWYWVSDEPWAWACYHYGRWFWHPAYGWTWAPDTEWAPAWVAWREGGDYVGWAPLGAAPYPTHGYVFVERHRFCQPLTPAVIVHEHHHHYTTVINKTVIVKRDRPHRRPEPVVSPRDPQPRHTTAAAPPRDRPQAHHPPPRVERVDRPRPEQRPIIIRQDAPAPRPRETRREPAAAKVARDKPVRAEPVVAEPRPEKIRLPRLERITALKHDRDVEKN